LNVLKKLEKTTTNRQNIYFDIKISKQIS